MSQALSLTVKDIKNAIIKLPKKQIREIDREIHRILTSPEKDNPILKFAGILSNEEAKEMRDIIEEEFEKVNPDEWKD